MNTRILWAMLALLILTLGLSTVHAQDDSAAKAVLEQPDANAITINGDATEAPEATWQCGDTLYSHSSSTNTPVWISYYGGDNATVYFRVYGREYGNPIDPIMTLYAPDGTTVLASSDNFDGLDPLIHYTYTANGTYKIKVEDIDGGSGRGAFYIYYDLPVYVSMATSGTVGGINYDAGDVLRYRRCANQWDMFLDMSNVGVTGNTAGFAIELGTSYGQYSLMSFAAKTSVPGLGMVPPQDIVWFYSTDVGNDTAGVFSKAIDGSDVGLTTANEAIDGIMIGESGNLLISLSGAGAVPKVSGVADEDLLRFRASQFGSVTKGKWDLYFDGSDVGLAGADIAGVWKQGNTNDYYLAFDAPISGSGANAALGDLSFCRATKQGPTTACTWYNGVFDASYVGLTGAVDAVDMGGALAYVQTTLP